MGHMSFLKLIESPIVKTELARTSHSNPSINDMGIHNYDEGESHVESNKALFYRCRISCIY